VDINGLLASQPAVAWEGALPWGDAAFSRRMLAEHLSQDHDWASRRFERIDAHVAWLHELVGGSGRVLDLGCGPGLYTARLAALGHDCVGIDVGPASIRHAASEAGRLGLRCEYRLADLTRGFGCSGFDLVMFLYGEIDTIPPTRAASVLAEMVEVVLPGGVAVLEVHTPDAVRAIGDSGRTWRTAPSGLFSDRPHLLLDEASWDEGTRTAVRRIWVMEEAGTLLHSVTTQARDYTKMATAVQTGVVVRLHPRGSEPWVDDRFEVLVISRSPA
jgi:SAM-dependent methyltransferase